MRYRVTIAEYQSAGDGERRYDGFDNIYEQQVEELDVQAVIATVNGAVPTKIGTAALREILVHATIPEPGTDARDGEP